MREYLESGIKLLDLNLPIETIDKLIKYHSQDMDTYAENLKSVGITYQRAKFKDYEEAKASIYRRKMGQLW